MFNLKNIVYSIAVTSFVLSCCCQFFDRLNSIYTVNFLAETAFLFIFLKYRKTKEWTVLIFWLSFYLASIAIYINNDIAYGEITTTLKLLGYLMLLLYIYPKQKTIKFEKLDLLVYGLVFLVNIYVVYEVVRMISSFISTQYMIILYSFYGFVLISLFIIAFRYRLLYDSRSKYVLFLTSFLAIAEILGIIAYFLGYEFLYYFENFFYLFGLSFAVTAFIYENKKRSVHGLIKTGGI